MKDVYWRITESLRRIDRMRRQVMDRSFEEFGITPGQHFVLMHLERMGNVLSQVQIAEEMHVTPANVARTVKSLDAAGYIQRVIGEDERRNEICVTPRGRELIERSHSIFRGMNERCFQGFDSEELEALRTMLERVLANLSQLEEESRRR